jgi:hypothetical protein
VIHNFVRFSKKLKHPQPNQNVQGELTCSRNFKKKKEQEVFQSASERFRARKNGYH